MGVRACGGGGGGESGSFSPVRLGRSREDGAEFPVLTERGARFPQVVVGKMEEAGMAAALLDTA